MHMPIMTESYLRRDFNFALYLGYCYGKTLTNLFKWSLWSTLIFFGAVVFTNIMLTIMEDEMIYGVLQLLIVVAALIYLIAMKSCLVDARNKLVPSILNDEGEMINPDHFNINVNAKSIDPFEDFADLPRMPYMDMNEENTTLSEE